MTGKCGICSRLRYGRRLGRRFVLREAPLEGAAREDPDEPAGPKRTRLVLTAARGDCWLLVRAGSQAGRTLYENLLRRGQRLSFRRPGLWIRLGAPGNVDIRLNGRPVGRLPGNAPRNVVVTARDVRAIS